MSVPSVDRDFRSKFVYEKEYCLLSKRSSTRAKSFSPSGRVKIGANTKSRERWMVEKALSFVLERLLRRIERIGKLIARKFVSDMQREDGSYRKLFFTFCEQHGWHYQ